MSTLTDDAAVEPQPRSPRPRGAAAATFDGRIVGRAILDAFKKLHPRVESRNPLMFLVEIGAVWTTVLFLRDLGRGPGSDSVFAGLIVLFLWWGGAS